MLTNQLLKLLQSKAETDESVSLRLRHILCEFLAVSASLVLARSDDNIQNSVCPFTRWTH
jgi:hypothetical protein